MPVSGQSCKKPYQNVWFYIDGWVLWEVQEVQSPQTEPLGHTSTSQVVGLLEDSCKSAFNSFTVPILSQSQSYSFSCEQYHLGAVKGS